jgi:hypothetical protein
MGELLLMACVFEPSNRRGGQGCREVAICAPGCSYHPSAGLGELVRSVKLVLKGGMFRCRWVA